jgi:hypothetical protein
MQKLFFPLCFISLTFLVGCDDIGLGKTGRYSGEMDAAGNFLILDTKTGNVEVLKDEQLILIPKDKDLEQVKEYPAQNIPGMPVEIGELRTKFRDGKLLYQGYVKPIINQPQDGSNKTAEAASVLFERMEALWEGGSQYRSRQITIQLFDKDGFEILNFMVTRGEMTRTVDRNSNPVKLSFDGSEPISAKDFESINGYSFSWNLADWKDTDPKK